MRIAERAAERATERVARGVRARAEAEVGALVDAALAVLLHAGANGLTVADVLAESGLSTRAFYRCFASRDELVLAVFEREKARSDARLAAAVAAASTTRAAFEAWVGETLALGFEPRRARHTRTLWAEGERVRREFPAEFAAIFSGLLTSLVAVLERGRADATFPLADPEADARSIHAVVWDLVQRRLDGETTLRLADARTHALRFCLPALGPAT